MELNILKAIKQLRQALRRKPTKVVEKKIVKKIKPTKSKPKREQIMVDIDGRCLSLSRIAQIYKLKPHTVYARYRVGNRGKLLIRPTPKQHTKT